jgi:hypothetical protein
MELPAWLRLRLKTFWIDYTFDANETSAIISLACSPTVSVGVWEIGEKHVFARRSKFPFLAFLRKRRLRELSITIKRKSELRPEIIEKLNLSESKIGKLWFEPPKKRDKSGPGCPASLRAVVWVNDELHQSLRALIQAVERPTWLRLTLEVEAGGALHYGWEPDGSRMVWKIENENEPSCLDVSSIDVSFYRSGPLRSRLLALGD